MMMEWMIGFIDQLWMAIWYMPLMVGIGIGGAFNFSKSNSDFRNEQGISRQNRNLIFPETRSLTSSLAGQGRSDLQSARPGINLDQFGFLQQPGGFNMSGFIQQLIGNALSQTAAQGTARGQVSPENLKAFAGRAAQGVAGQLLPLTQQNILQAQTLPAQFALQRAQVGLQGPQGLAQLATGGGSGQGSSNALAFGASANASAL